MLRSSLIEDSKVGLEEMAENNSILDSSTSYAYSYILIPLSMNFKRSIFRTGIILKLCTHMVIRAGYEYFQQ